MSMSSRNLNRTTHAASTAAKSTKRPTSPESIAEKYTNKTFNRVPSPLPRTILRPPTRRQITVGHKEKGQLQSSVPKPNHKSLIPVGERRSAIIKRSLDNQSGTQLQRPRTSCSKRPTKKGLTTTPSFEKNLLCAFKDVLSRAVSEKGKIDGNNLDAIITDMKHHLRGEVNKEDDHIRDDIDLNMKLSMTEVNVGCNQGKVSNSNSKHFSGLIRKEVLDCSPDNVQRVYKSMYTKEELKDESQKGLENTRTGAGVDPSDTCSSKTVFIMKQGEVISSESQKKYKKEEVQEVRDQEDRSDNQHKSLQVEEKGIVGDCQTKNVDSCKFFEDAKLKTYIESLVINIKDQLNSQLPRPESENTKVLTYCKSICVCKVCESDRNSVIKVTPKTSDNKKPEVQPKSINRSVASVSRPVSPTSQQKPNKRPVSDSNCRVLKRNHNFVPESSVNLSPIKETKKTPTTNVKPSSNVANPSNTDEDSEDMYLQRRRLKVAQKPRMTKLGVK